jgi:putative proteasome-type protease
MIYHEGNFFDEGDETTLFLIGVTKYGNHIIVRAFDPTMSVEHALRVLCVSFDSTLKANLSVGMPLDVHIYESDSLQEGEVFRIEEDDTSFKEISSSWDSALKTALEALPKYQIPSTKSTN